MRVRIGQDIFDLLDLLGQGAQGSAYAHPENPREVVKIYARVGEFDGRRIEAMVQRPPSPLMEKNGTPTFAFPLATAHDAKTGAAVGFVMPRAEGSLELQRVVNPTQRIPEIGPRWLLHVAKSLVMRIYALHWEDYVVGDIQLGNALVNRHGQVTLIDLDSLQFTTPQGECFPALYGIPSFQAPEVLGKKPRLHAANERVGCIFARDRRPHAPSRRRASVQLPLSWPWKAPGPTCPDEGRLLARLGAVPRLRTPSKRAAVLQPCKTASRAFSPHVRCWA